MLQSNRKVFAYPGTIPASSSSTREVYPILTVPLTLTSKSTELYHVTLPSRVATVSPPESTSINNRVEGCPKASGWHTPRPERWHS